jgi:glycosyltransferase involved in cell wall biosynthesis
MTSERRTVLFHSGCLTRTPGGDISSNESVIQLYNALANAWGGMDLIAPVAEKAAPKSFAIDPRAIHVIPLPGFASGWEYHFCKFVPIAWRLNAVIQEHASSWKRLWLVDLDPLCFVARISAERVGLAAFAYLRGDDVLEVVARRGPLLRAPARIYAAALAQAGKWLVRRTPTFVAGHDLYLRYRDIQPRLSHFVPTVLREAELDRSPRAEPGKPFRMLFVGRFVALKGLEVLLSAFAEQYHAGFDIQLTLVGEGPLHRSLKCQAVALGIDSAVHFTGFVLPGPALDRIYRDHDLFVLPSYSEGFPKVLIEAFAKGMPVLSTKVGSVPIVVQHGDNGVLVPPGNANQLGLAIRTLVNDISSWRRMSDGAKASAHLYTVERQVKRIEAFISGGEN